MNNFEFRHLLPESFDASSRVWIYQSNRIFSLGEVLQLEDILTSFAENWKSHGTPVKGFATVFFGQFIVLMADETATGVSGCSTDSSVRLIKELEQAFNVSLFDRLSLGFIIKNKVQVLPMNQLKYAWDNKFIDAETPYFNNLVQTKAELENGWIVPLKASWLAKKLPAISSSY